MDGFVSKVWEHYRDHGRSFPWRKNYAPYQVLVSEIMLQQTQTYRVEPKFTAFIQRFPTIHSLAQSSLKEVLIEWVGLGYNRRAKFLHDAAVKIVTNYSGNIPSIPEQLVTLPGIGPNTAGSIAAFAYNYPSVFIETNIRSVFIYHFFEGSDNVHDRDIMPLIEHTLDRKNPREWYWALMDYGASLKKAFPNPSKRSKHYTRQSSFNGSLRQLRATVLKHLIYEGPATYEHLQHVIPDSRLQFVLSALHKETMIHYCPKTQEYWV